MFTFARKILNGKDSSPLQIPSRAGVLGQTHRPTSLLVVTATRPKKEPKGSNRDSSDLVERESYKSAGKSPGGTLLQTEDNTHSLLICSLLNTTLLGRTLPLSFST